MTALERTSTASEPHSAMASTANARRLLVPRPCCWAQLQPLSSAIEHRTGRHTGHRSVSRLRDAILTMYTDAHCAVFS